MRLLHAFYIVEVNLFSDSATGFGDNLVVILHLLALVHERSHLGLSAVIDEHWSDLKDGLWMEILLRIGHRDCGVDVAGHTLQNRRVTLYGHIVSKFSHLLG